MDIVYLKVSQQLRSSAGISIHFPICHQRLPFHSKEIYKIYSLFYIWTKIM